MQIRPSMTHGGSQFTPDQWATAATDIVLGRSTEGRVARGMITLAWGGLAVGSAYGAIGTTGRIALAVRRNPVLYVLANHGRNGALRAMARIALGGSKVLRYAGYVQFSISPLMTYKYLKRGDYRRAALNYYGPPGTVWVYNRLSQTYEKKSKQPEVVKRSKQITKSRRSKSSQGKTPSQMPDFQKKRLWRMGLRWCNRHGRYDYCNRRRG